MLQQELVAGPLRIDLCALETRSIRAAGVELVRRIYFAVRDPAWGNVPPEVLMRTLDHSDGGFVLEAHCRYRADPIELDARISICGSADGLLRYESTSIAGSSFPYNRIGFCILHPPAELSGATLTLDADKEIVLSRRVIPQLKAGRTFAPAAGPFSRLAISGASGARVEFRFGGDRFELEDQRNWTDGSFKTYGTPLAGGPPAPLEVGAELKQSVEVRVLEPPRRARPAPQTVAELSLSYEVVTPRIGFAAGTPTAPGPLAALVHPAHLRVDYRDGRSSLERAFELAAAFSCGVQLGLHLPLTEAEHDELHALPRDVVTSVLVLHRDAERLTDASEADELRQLIDAGDQFWTGTDAYYAQLNRGLRPELGSCLTFSMHPQEHASDEQSMVETLEIQRDVVLDLKTKQPGCRVSVGAVTLGPRRSFSAPPGVAVNESAPDPRQSSLFGAVWTLASTRYLSEAGAEEVTYHALTGAGGLIDESGRATALLHLFADLAELGDRPRVVEGAPCTGLAFAHEGSLTLLLGNLRGKPSVARIPFVDGGRLRRLNAGSLARASEDAEAFRDEREPWRDDTLTFEPYEYVRLEGPA